MIDEKELLRNRARELAKQETNHSPIEGARKEMLEFILSGEHYAIETCFVMEAISLHDITPIPGTSAYLDGVMNVRGKIIPVVNLKRFFGLGEEGIVSTMRAVILHAGTYEVAVLTDMILSTQRIPESSMKPAPSTLHGIGVEHLLGVLEDATIILDGKSLISKLESSLTNRKS